MWTLYLYKRRHVVKRSLTKDKFLWQRSSLIRLRRLFGEGVHADSDHHENSGADLCWFWSRILYHSTYKTPICVKAAVFYNRTSRLQRFISPKFLTIHIISITIYNKHPLESGLLKETHNLFKLMAEYNVASLCLMHAPIPLHELHDAVCRATALYSRESGFKSHPRDLLYWLTLFMIFLSPSRQKPGCWTTSSSSASSPMYLFFNHPTMWSGIAQSV
jgi:hypothetical protein